MGRTAAPRGPLDLRGMRWAPVREVFLRDHARISVAVTGDARGRGREGGVLPSRRKATWIVHPCTSRLDYSRGINSEKNEFIDNINLEMPFPN